jgi:phosphate transport system substrate-binding protein
LYLDFNQGIATMLRTISLLAFASVALAACQPSEGVRDQIRVVGSSTVFPFATSVSELFVGNNSKFKAPTIESTGTGAGIKLFCAGVGVAHPDIVNASRQIKRSEYDSCRKNGVDKIVEIQIGLDGIAFAEGKTGPSLALSTVDVYKALAANPFGKPNTTKTWKDVNPALPAIPILVYGPPSTSGTRDALVELILTKGCDSDPAMVKLKLEKEDEHKAICTRIREDGAYVDAGENDNLIVTKIAGNPNAVGIFGFSTLEANVDKLKDVPLGGIQATYKTISDFSYPGARPLYIYVKEAHLKAIPGLREYVAEFAKAWGPDGVLQKRGMVIAPEAVRAVSEKQAKELTPLEPENLS